MSAGIRSPIDKFQAIRYLAAVAESGSFSAAARVLGVTTSAVKKLVNALERELGFPLVQARSRGVVLTADGGAYNERCKAPLRELADAEAHASASHLRPSGVLRLGITPSVAANCVMPALPAFHARYPDVEIDSSMAVAPSDENQELDVFVVMGWPAAGGLIQRPLAQQRHLICATPAYWERSGVPREPKDLERSTCVNFRARVGTVLDRFTFVRGSDEQIVDMRGYVVSNDSVALLETALAGGGFMVITDLVTQRELRSGMLVPVLLDWEIRHAPPISVLYRANQRQSPRVRIFTEFVVELFRDLDARRVPAAQRVSVGTPPVWIRSKPGRSSAERGRGRPS